MIVLFRLVGSGLVQVSYLEVIKFLSCGTHFTIFIFK